MALEHVFTWLAIFIWVGIGACIVLAAWAVAEHRREKAAPEYNPYAALLGKPAWRNVNGDWLKYRVVAVSHKGAVSIRKWEDDSGKHAKWFTKQQVKDGYVRFGECPDTEGAAK